MPAQELLAILFIAIIMQAVTIALYIYIYMINELCDCVHSKGL